MRAWATERDGASESFSSNSSARILPGFAAIGQSRKPVRGEVGSALSEPIPRPASRAVCPASTARRKARAIAMGSPEEAMAVFTKTASAPISRASAACEGAPSPASTMTGTRACSMMMRRKSRESRPRFEPIGAPSGMTAAAPTSSRRFARTGSAWM